MFTDGYSNLTVQQEELFSIKATHVSMGDHEVGLMTIPSTRSMGTLKKVALVACMHTLLVTLNAMLAHQTPWRTEALPP